MAIVVPMLAGAFQEVGGRIAGPMQTLNSFSQWFIRGPVPGWLIMVIAPFAIVLGIVLIRNSSEAGRFLYDSVKLKIPLLGLIARKFAVARFSRVLGTLIEAGVPIVDAIRISRQVAGNAVFTRALEKVQEAVREGEGFTGPLLATGMFDSTFVNMVEVGEETGDLDKMLLKVADNYENEAETLTTGLTTLLGPVMLIVIGLIVGFIVVNLVLSIQGLIFNAI
jgi:type IV pilus assembly protein PilC